MLDLPQTRLFPESQSPSATLGPYSLDAMEHERDGVPVTLSKPFSSAHSYYNYKRDIWKQRLESQRNSITSRDDGRRKLLDDAIDNLFAGFARRQLMGPRYN